jgi:signal transduction histidine kinase
VAGGSARARVDARRLKEAILNLALNALAASRPADRVELRCTARGGLTIAIADSGRGMTSAELARVGTPGYTTRPGGTGLGVVLARRIVEQHGGTLTFTSAPGRGTTAQIELPEAT